MERQGHPSIKLRQLERERKRDGFKNTEAGQRDAVKQRERRKRNKKKKKKKKDNRQTLLGDFERRETERKERHENVHREGFFGCFYFIIFFFFFFGVNG